MIKENKSKKRLNLKKGCSGALSILLALLILPFWSITAVVIEAGRYNSSITLLDELLNSSSLSALAHYDPHIRDRFGFLAINQNTNPDLLVQDYFGRNEPLLAKSLDVKPLSISGVYPLADPDILRQQILEYGKYNVPPKIVNDTLKLEVLVGWLEKMAGVGKWFSMFGELGNLVEKIKQLFQGVAEYETIALQLLEEIDEFEAVYAKLEMVVNRTVEAHKELDDDLDDPDDAELQNHKERMQKLEREFEEEKKAYADCHRAIIETSYEMTDKLQELVDGLLSLPMAIADLGLGTYDALGNSKRIRELEKANEDAKNTIRDLEALPAEEMTREKEETLRKKLKETTANDNELTDLYMKANLVEAGEQAVKTVTDAFDIDEMRNKPTLSIEKARIEMEVQLKRLENLEFEDLSAEYDIRSFETEFGHVDFSDLAKVDLFKRIAKKIFDDLKGLVDLLKGLVSFIKAIFDVELIADPALNHHIDSDFRLPSKGDKGLLPKGYPEDARYSEEINLALKVEGDRFYSDSELEAGEPDSMLQLLIEIDQVTASIENMNPEVWSEKETDKWYQTFLKKAGNFAAKLVQESVLKLWQLLSGVVKILRAIKNVGKYISDLVGQMSLRIQEVLTGTFDKGIVVGYFAYNLPNRTNYLSGKTLTGFSFTDCARAPQGEEYGLYNYPAVRHLAGLVKATCGQRKDISFRGAELEYIIAGHPSEYGNQLQVFSYLYLMRLIMGLPTPFLDKEVQGYAKIPIVGQIYLAVVILFEPLIDALMLVNGVKIPLIKWTAWLTVEGIIDALGEFSKVIQQSTKLTSTQKQAKRDKLIDEGYSLHEKGAQYNKNYELMSKDKYINQVTASGNKWTKFRDGALETDYQGYLFLWMWIFGKQATYINRMGDLIQMEMRQKETNEKKTPSFDLDRSYTYVRVEADADLKIMFPFPGLSTRSPFGTKRVLYRGY